MGIFQLLATAATATASATAPAPQAGLLDIVVYALAAVWLSVSIALLVKFRVFSSGPLESAPARTAVFLLPLVLLLTLAFYSVLVRVAIHSGVEAGVIPAWFERQTFGPAANQPAAAPASNPAEAPPARELSPREDMWAQSCGVAAELAASGLGLAACEFLFIGGLAGMGLAPRKIVPGLLVGALAIFVLLPLLYADSFIVGLVYDALGHKTSLDDTISQLQQSHDVVTRIGDTLLAVIAVPIAEETFFRGILQSALIQRPGGFAVQWMLRRSGLQPRPVVPRPPTPMRRLMAILVTALIFAGMHPTDHFPVIFPLAVGLGYVYERTGNLYANITMHAIFNGTSLLLVFLGS